MSEVSFAIRAESPARCSRERLRLGSHHSQLRIQLRGHHAQRLRLFRQACTLRQRRRPRLRSLLVLHAERRRLLFASQLLTCCRRQRPIQLPRPLLLPVVEPRRLLVIRLRIPATFL